MVHEGGHAVHSFLAHPLSLSAFKEYPMEIAEVASMAMELFSMQHWQPFFEKESDLLNIFFVYSECIKELASDRPDDFFKVMNMLQKETV